MSEEAKRAGANERRKRTRSHFRPPRSPSSHASQPSSRRGFAGAPRGRSRTGTERRVAAEHRETKMVHRVSGEQRREERPRVAAPTRPFRVLFSRYADGEFASPSASHDRVPGDDRFGAV